MKIRITDLLTNAYSDTDYEVGSPACKGWFMEDYVTKKFRRRRDAGELIINPMNSCTSIMNSAGNLDYEFAEEQLTGGIWTKSVHTRVHAQSGFSSRFRIPLTPLHVAYADPLQRTLIQSSFDFSGAHALESGLLARATAKASDSDAIAMVTLAELNKTFDLFHDLGKSAKRFDAILRREEVVRGATRGSYKTARRFKKRLSRRELFKAGGEVTSAWLAYRYGLMATYYDVMSWVDASKHIGEKRRARFTSSTQSKYSTGRTGGLLASGFWADEYRYSRLSRETTSSAGVLVGLDLGLDHLEAHGFEKVISTAWELVPYSFVIDWFLDIGTRLAALEGQILRPVLGSWIVHRHRLVRTEEYYETGKTYYYGPTNRARMIGMLDQAYITDTALVVERKANPTLSVIPSIKVNLNTNRIADGLSLLTQVAQRKRGYY